jgi:hypothetical protein
MGALLSLVLFSHVHPTMQTLCCHRRLSHAGDGWRNGPLLLQNLRGAKTLDFKLRSQNVMLTEN